MIHLNEIVKPEVFGRISIDHRLHISHIHYAVNCIRSHFKNPLIINDYVSRFYSGYRTIEEHIKLYDLLNEKRLMKNKPRLSVPMKSQHLIGAAVDLFDPTFEIKKWVLDHLDIIERLDLYMEDFDATGGIDGGWLHIGLYPPQSGKRFFKP